MRAEDAMACPKCDGCGRVCGWRGCGRPAKVNACPCPERPITCDRCKGAGLVDNAKLEATNAR